MFNRFSRKFFFSSFIEYKIKGFDLFLNIFYCIRLSKFKNKKKMFFSQNIGKTGCSYLLHFIHIDLDYVWQQNDHILHVEYDDVHNYV
jgi:hypothetical protein